MFVGTSRYLIHKRQASSSLHAQFSAAIRFLYRATLNRSGTVKLLRCPKREFMLLQGRLRFFKSPDRTLKGYVRLALARQRSTNGGIATNCLDGTLGKPDTKDVKKQ